MKDIPSVFFHGGLHAHYSMWGGHKEENGMILNLNNRLLLLFYFPGKLW